MNTEVEDKEIWRIERAAKEHETRTNDGRYSNVNLANLLAFQQLERNVLSTLSRRGYADFRGIKVLEVGCGTARWLREFIKWGAQPQNLYGVDLIESRIAFGREICPPSVHLTVGNAAALDFPDKTFDVVVQSTVFTSILDEAMRSQVAGEMLRVLKPDGVIVWYDLAWNNPNNSDVRGVGKTEIRYLFPRSKIDAMRVTLAPPIGRTVAPVSSLLYTVLSKMSFLRSHCLAFISKDQIRPVLREHNAINSEPANGKVRVEESKLISSIGARKSLSIWK